mmetsp:Transcript_13972/g.21146  ORF Transcript_13972/g.21146 Transcript_13972/m.21146 type:complete len:265 (+) Transcript_13972:3-797(+)
MEKATSTSEITPLLDRVDVSIPKTMENKDEPPLENLVVDQPLSNHISQTRKKIVRSTSIKEGILYKYEGFLWKKWKPYYFILKKNVLLMKKKRSESKILQFVNLQRTSIWPAKNDTGSENSIMIYHPLRSTIYLKARTKQSCTQWIEGMKLVKSYLDEFDTNEQEEYTSSDEQEVTCCGIRLPKIHFFRRRGVVKEYVFEKQAAEQTFEEATMLMESDDEEDEEKPNQPFKNEHLQKEFQKMNLEEREKLENEILIMMRKKNNN